MTNDSLEGTVASNEVRSKQNEKRSKGNSNDIENLKEEFEKFKWLIMGALLMLAFIISGEGVSSLVTLL